MFKTESGDSFEVCPVTIDKKTVIPPNSVVRTLVKSSLLNETYAIHSVNSQGLLIPNTVVTGGGTHVPVQLVNDQNRYVRLKKGHVIGHAIQCDVVPEVIDTDLSFKVRSITDKPPSQQVDELPEHLSGLFSRSVNNLDNSEQKQLKTLLLEFQHIFSKGSGDLGCFSEIKHKINTGDERPVKQPMRRTPIGFEKEEEENLKLMLEIGVISELSSDWASAPVLVRKKDGSVRYCIDFRCVNDKTVKDLFPLPSISQCLDQLSGNMYFSTLDMASGYWQIEIDEQDRHKTAFITKFGLFEHRRMALGLCNAPATFQRVIKLVLRGLTWDKILAYLDDVIVLGKNFQDHIKNLRTTFERFAKYNLKLKPKKCVLFQTETMFLGRIVSSEGVGVDPNKIEKVKN